MNFTNYKYKLVVSVCLMQSEKSRIKEIIEAYNIRLNTIYSSISSMLDDLEKINFIEAIPNEKEQINNLINFVNDFNNIEELETIKNEIDEKIKKINETNNKINESAKINNNEYLKIKIATTDNLKEEQKNNIIYSYANTEVSTTTEEQEQEQEKEQEPQININLNNDDSNLKQEISKLIEIDQKSEYFDMCVNSINILHEKIKNGKNKKDAFAEICIELMAQGGDADTNGTVVGSLCGSYVGFDGIEKSLIDGLGAGDEGRKVGKVRDGRGGFHEIQEKKLLEEIVQSSHQKIDPITPTNDFTRSPLSPSEPLLSRSSSSSSSSSSSFKGDEDWEVNPKFIIGGILAGAGIGVCVSALTVGIVFSVPAVATMTAGVALGGLAGYAVGTIVKNANAENIASTESVKSL